jgi:hypothetical protein
MWLTRSKLKLLKEIFHDKSLDDIQKLLTETKLTVQENQQVSTGFNTSYQNDENTDSDDEFETGEDFLSSTLKLIEEISGNETIINKSVAIEESEMASKRLHPQEVAALIPNFDNKGISVDTWI